MSLAALGAGYLALGAAIAALAWAARGLAFRDAVLVLALWPIAAPLLFAPALADERDPLRRALVAAQGAPLGAAVPGAARTRQLIARHAAAHARLAALDDLLARPAVVGAAAATAPVVTAWAAQDHATALASARALRARLAGALDEIAALGAQVAAQAELARVAPGVVEGAAHVVALLVERVDELAEVDAAAAEYPRAPGRS